MNIKILIEYDGTRYSGWQRQKNAMTIQQTIEEALEKITGEKVRIIGSGRTDARVHALEQVANFKTNTKIPIDKLPYAINSQLPEDIVVKDAKIVPEDFHARFSAKEKSYVYKIYNGPYPSPLVRNYSYWFSKPLDVKAMNEAGKRFLGVHDFSAFRASGSPVKTSVREIYKLSFQRNHDMITMEVSANGFLYNMVRIIAGTLLDVGLHYIDIDEIDDIILSKDRNRAGRTLPPQGLCLMKVTY